MAALDGDPEDRFEHEEHRTLFPSCVPCHAGIVEPDAALWPATADCAACHDGVVEDTVDWSPPEALPRTNLAFDHREHARVVAGDGGEPVRCVDCHAEPGAEWMSVRLAAVSRCLDCHGIEEDHLAAPDSSCATCHLPLARAERLTEGDVAAFEAPPSHDEPGYASRGGHGLLGYRPPGREVVTEIAPSCAVCHARDFCIQCHVDAPEQPAIQELAPDRRSLVFEAALAEPESHAAPDFVTTHGSTARATPLECRTCHTQESCIACHVATPDAAEGMFRAGAGRGPGARIARAPPAGHTSEFMARLHESDAAAEPASCAGCHAREDCLDCHRPVAARAAPGYHPADFLSRHPVAAFRRETSCGDCHNARAFCADCHAQAGLVATEPLGSGYHDGKRFFIVGHGQAARQSLESCVACHTERDCLACHSAERGRRFNPHGPGFDAERLRKRNPEMCIACHGLRIPEEP